MTIQELLAQKRDELAGLKRELGLIDQQLVMQQNRRNEVAGVALRAEGAVAAFEAALTVDAVAEQVPSSAPDESA